MVEKQKVLVYITQADRLLVFTHPDSPEAGIQVPGGSIKSGETAAEAALREAREETGLQQLRTGILLGELRRNMSDFGIKQIHHRYYFHMCCDEQTPERWRHGEFDASDEGQRAAPIPFDLYWVRLPDGVPPLIAGHNAFIAELTLHLQQRQDEAI